MDLLKMFAAGITDPETIEAVRRVESSGNLFNDPETIPVEDEDGNLLLVNHVYLRPDGKKLRITKCRFGSGNMMDTWYWVYGINEDLNEDRITVDVKHRKGMSAHYPSELKKA